MKPYYEYMVIRDGVEIKIWHVPSQRAGRIVVRGDGFDVVGQNFPRSVVEKALDYLGHDLASDSML